MAASSHRRFSTLLRRFSQVRVLVIGDLMLDRYIWGQVERISPEAPVPIVRVSRENIRAGGAGNVVANIQALGGRAVACGIIGKDQAGQQLLQELRATAAGTAGVVATRMVQTTSKIRIIAHSQQLVRLDREHPEEIDRRRHLRLQTFVQQHVSEFDVIVVSDYAKGVINVELLTVLAELRDKHRFVYLIDPKRRHFAYYRGASLVKPNKEEAGLAAGVEIRDQVGLCQAGERLLDLWQAEAILVSRGEEGMSLFQRQKRAQHFPTTAREVFDVTGAGDTVLATCALALGAGATLEEATILANYGAGVVVGKVGTATVNPAELHAAFQESTR
jgi:D-beta-D-heptose 7-phosphate kinase/D-beta-D-heptose 1-phosphate adenosyltransferase